MNTILKPKDKKMAFDKKKLVRTSAGIVAGATEHYDYDAGADTVTTKSYFPKDDVLKQGDIVTAISKTIASGLITKFSKTEYVLVADAAGELIAKAIPVA